MLIDFVIRSGLVYGVITATRRFGVWDTPERAEQAYGTSKTYVKPYVERAVQRVHMEPPPLPPQGRRSFLAIYYYNQFVLKFFNFLNFCPTYMHDALIVVPMYVQKLAQYARSYYQKYQEKRTQGREIQKGLNRRCIDERPLVKPEPKPEHKPEPKPDCKCDKTPAKTLRIEDKGRQ